MSLTRVVIPVLCLPAYFAVVLTLTHQGAVAQETNNAREGWNKIFREDAGFVPNQPSAFLVSVTKGRTPGVALDLGTGQGRNAVYLAATGWTVTGVDVSDVAIEQAKKNAASRGVTLNAIVGDLDVFDFEKQKWDLITSFYMHSWHRKSRTDVAGRIFDALKPGGLVIIEGFADPPNNSGLKAEELAKAFGGLRVLRSETLSDEPDWGRGAKRPIVRFVAQKPR